MTTMPLFYLNAAVKNTITKAVKNLGGINGKWVCEYDEGGGLITLVSATSGRKVKMLVIITINNDFVELRSHEDDFAFFTQEANTSWFSNNLAEELSSALEDEVKSLLSEYWSRK